MERSADLSAGIIEKPLANRFRVMNAEPLLHNVARVFSEHRLEVIMVGNAAAALHGAPVTTLDIDFMFRKTPLNLKNSRPSHKACEP